MWCRRAPTVSPRHTENCVPEFTIVSALELPSYGLVVFIDMNMYILAEGKNLKTFLKENYATALDSNCYQLLIC